MKKPANCYEKCAGRFSHGLAARFGVIAGKWKPQVLHFSLGGPKCYGELKRTIPGVSDKVPIQQLKELESDRVLSQTGHKEAPPRVDCALTPLGCSLADEIVLLSTWGTDNMAQMVGIFAARDAPP